MALIKTLSNRAFLLLIATTFIITACNKVPVTGRKQISLLPENQLIGLSLTNYGEFMTTHKLSNNMSQTQMVKKVGKNIANAVNTYLTEKDSQSLIENYQWEYNLIEEDVPNAWCMPGGKIVVYTGILPYTIDEAGLAVVMGHEVAHAVARHGNERMSHQIIMEYGVSFLSTFIEEKPEQTQILFQQALGLGAQYGVMLPYSRMHETEADKMGLIFMAIAGYDPQKATEFWERMSKSGGQKPPEIISTHPSDESRIKTMKEFMPEALKYYKNKPLKLTK
jgi:predicted Zn-dependent protease